MKSTENISGINGALRLFAHFSTVNIPLAALTRCQYPGLRLPFPTQGDLPTPVG